MPSRSLASPRGLRIAANGAYTCPSCVLDSARSVASRLTPSLPPTSRRRISVPATIAPPSRLWSTQARRLLPGHHRQLRNNVSIDRSGGARRNATSDGSWASATAINAPSTVPPAYRDLHQKLLLLQDEASSYVDLSRLQLATRSLESHDPVVRVALLGLGADGALAARTLARVILSDALGSEDSWEKELLESGEDGRSIVLRYGDSEDAAQQSPLVRTMHIPSPFLQRHNIEILVTTLNAHDRAVDQAGQAEMEETILVPPLTTPTSAGGRVGFVRYPVHKALVVAEGITGAVAYGRLPRSLDKSTLVNAALSLPLRSSTGATSAEQATTDNVIDIDLASHALALFRASTANGAQFSEEWQTSRMPGLSEWIAGPPQRDSSDMRTAVRKLLDSVLLNASSAIERSETEQTSAAASATVPDDKRSDLNRAIVQWSEEAHSDLQLNLTAALSSPTWRRTAWWRLLWRIDDVSVSAGDILRLSWLTEAEQNLAFLSGRIAQAGLATPDELKEPGTGGRVVAAGVEAEVESWEPKQAQIMSPADLLQAPTLLARVQQQSGINALFDPPWPQTIHLSRQQMLHTTVPRFHRTAQSLLLSTLSTIGGTAALGAWLCVATADLSAGGAVAALGAVWSLRRLQRRWSQERDTFAAALREDGRKVLAEVESQLRTIVQAGGRAHVSREDQRGWQRARAAIERCRDALDRV